jgi:hypothetical protein
VAQTTFEEISAADFFYRASSKPQKAVILLGGSEGGKSWSDATDFIQELVDEARLADAGFTADDNVAGGE